MTTVATSSTTGFSTKFFLTWLMALTIAGIIAGVLENTLWQFGTTIVLEGILIGTAQAIVLAGRIRRPWLWASMTGFLFIPARLLTGPITSLSSDILVDLFGVRFSFWLNSTAMALLVALVAFGIWALYEELSSVWIALNLIGGFLVGVVSAALCLWLCQALTESVG
ncbi:MAG: hypothetical protein KDD78_07735, partial [Caldilineaceae bacterium]|nr:hypothetical protein [Caldilineaceae bacterium]